MGSTVGEIGAHAKSRRLAFGVAAEVCHAANAFGFAVKLAHVEETLASAMQHRRIRLTVAGDIPTSTAICPPM